MKRNAMHYAFAAVASLVFAGTAHAAYRCDAPQSRLDRLACQAAEQGPDTLRRFIERMRPAHSLNFYDYVTEAQLLAWQAAEAQARADARVDAAVRAQSAAD